MDEEQEMELINEVSFTSDRLYDVCGLAAAIGVTSFSTWLAFLLPFGTLIWGVGPIGAVLGTAWIYRQKEELMKDKSEVVTDEFPI